MHETMIQLLRDLEWTGSVGTAPAYMGGRSMGQLPACPLCRGVRPSRRAEFEFNSEAIGHRPDCKLYQQLKRIGGYKDVADPQGR